MRALQIVNSLSPGGLEVQLLRSIAEFHRLGVQADICCLGARKELDDAFESAGARIWRIPKKANPHTTAKCIRKLLGTTAWDVVHSHLGHTSGGFALGSFQSHTPCVISFHSCEPLALLGWKTRPGLKQLRQVWLSYHEFFMRKYASYFIGQSKISIQNFEPRWRQQPERFAALSNGVVAPGTLGQAGRSFTGRRKAR